jgi:hypothetical protein
MTGPDLQKHLDRVLPVKPEGWPTNGCNSRTAPAWIRRPASSTRTPTPKCSRPANPSMRPAASRSRSTCGRTSRWPSQASSRPCPNQTGPPSRTVCAPRCAALNTISARSAADVNMRCKLCRAPMVQKRRLDRANGGAARLRWECPEHGCLPCREGVYGVSAQERQRRTKPCGPCAKKRRVAR